MDEQKRELVMFFDLVGRTIIGAKTGETTDEVFVKNPVVVNIVPHQTQDPATGQPVQRMALQLLPLFFREFLADPTEGVEFAYNKKNITLTRNPAVFDFKLDIQYDQITSAPVARQAPAPIAPAKADEKIIKLFED